MSNRYSTRYSTTGSTARVIDLSDHLRPTRPAARRSPQELATAERMLRQLRGQLAGSGTRLGPTRRAVLRAAIDEAHQAQFRPAEAALERAADRLLAELEGECHQPIPFDVAASAVEEAMRQVRE